MKNKRKNKCIDWLLVGKFVSMCVVVIVISYLTIYFFVWFTYAPGVEAGDLSAKNILKCYEIGGKIEMEYVEDIFGNVYPSLRSCLVK